MASPLRARALRRAARPASEAMEPRRLLSGGFDPRGVDELAPVGVLATLTVAEYRADPGTVIDSATVDWGDGTATTAGTVEPVLTAGPALPDGLITGQHAYAAAGTFDVTVTIQEHQGDAAGQLVAVHANAVAAVPTLDLDPAPGPTEAAGFAFQEQVAGLRVTPYLGGPSTFHATIDWGDGSAPVDGTVTPAWAQPIRKAWPAPSLGPSRFDVRGSHTYAAPGDYAATITVDDGLGHSAQATTTVHVVADPLRADAPLPRPIGAVAGVPLSAGRPFGPALGGFTDLRSLGWSRPPATDLKATIDWGDGSAPAAGAILPDAYIPEAPPGHLRSSVSGDHAYASPGTYTARVTVTGDGGIRTEFSATVDVAAAPPRPTLRPSGDPSPPPATPTPAPSGPVAPPAPIASPAPAPIASPAPIATIPAPNPVPTPTPTPTPSPAASAQALFRSRVHGPRSSRLARQSPHIAPLQAAHAPHAAHPKGPAARAAARRRG